MTPIAFKPLVAGDFSGPMMVSATPLSFFGEVDVQTGNVVSANSDLCGRSVHDQVLCLPFTHGSAGAWRVLQQLRTHGTAPLGIIVRDMPDPSVIQGAILGNIPVMRLIDADTFALLREGHCIAVTQGVGRIEVDARMGAATANGQPC